MGKREDLTMATRKSKKAKSKEPVLTEHEKRINRLIPTAMRIAQERAKKLKEPSESRPGAEGRQRVHVFLDEFYHEEMDRLKYEAGLLSYNPEKRRG